MLGLYRFGWASGTVATSRDVDGSQGHCWPEWPKGAASVDHRAVVVEGDTDTVRVVGW